MFATVGSADDVFNSFSPTLFLGSNPGRTLKIGREENLFLYGAALTGGKAIERDVADARADQAQRRQAD
jgi:hypothetical protein